MNNEIISPPEDIIAAFTERANDFCMLPAVAIEALTLANSPDCSVGQFAQVVERDVKLATDILTMANSVLFGDGGAVASLRQAVVRLGFGRCKNLILISASTAMIRNMPLRHEHVREIIWQHSQRTAVVCSHLNESMGLGFRGEEYAAGLLHDLGRLLLAVAMPEPFDVADAISMEDQPEILEQERSVFGTDHCEFGAWFAQRNGLPSSLVSVISQHHVPVCGPADEKLVALVAAADHIANHFQRYERGEAYDVAGNPGSLVLANLGHPQLAGDEDGLARQTIEQLITASEGVALSA